MNSPAPTIELQARDVTSWWTALVHLAVIQSGFLVQLERIPQPRTAALILIPMAAAAVLLATRIMKDTPVPASRPIGTLLLVAAGWFVARLVPVSGLGPAWSFFLIMGTANTCGNRMAKTVLLPCLGVCFLGPMSLVTTESLADVQEAYARVTAILFSGFGVSLQASGSMLTWPEGSVEVSAECAGANSWQASLAWTWFLICMGQMRWKHIIPFLLIAVGLTMLANLVRIGVLVRLVLSYDTNLLEGGLHDGVGLLTYAVAFGLIIAIWLRMTRTSRHLQTRLR